MLVLAIYNVVQLNRPETVYTDLEGFPNHAQNTGDIPDVQDGYLMISELLGNEFPTSVPEHINPMHNDIGLHNGEVPPLTNIRNRLCRLD